MKQLYFTLLLTVLMSMVGAKTFAHSIEVTNADGVPIYYDYNGSRELEVTYYYKYNFYYDESGNWVEDYEQRPYSGNVAIPSTVTYYGTTYTVTSIGNNAFSDCSDLTSVTIPNSVMRIGDSAFSDCIGLTSVTIPSGVTYIGYNAFGYNDYTGTGEDSSLSLVNVKMETPAEIDSSTFPDRTSETLWVPKGCKAAYETADYWKDFMEIIEISNIDFADAKVKAICVSSWDTNGDGELNDIEAAQVYGLCSGVFSGNKSITSFDELQYFTGLHSIDNDAFENCSGLKSVTIPSCVTSIGDEAFSGCSSLTSVNIPSEVTSIGDGAFKNCRSLKEVNYDATNCTKMGSSSYYSSKVFEGCSSFTTLRIGENVQTIPSNAFYGCSGLTSVNIGNSVTSIGSSAFYNCSGLTSVNIGNSVTSIGSSAFYNCTGLTSVNIGNSVTSIGSSAFYGCSGLTSVNISDLAGWCKISFTNASDNPLYYAHHLFLNGEEITDLAIPSNVEYIENYAFYGCTGLTSLSIPSSVTSIAFGGYYGNAFYGCSNLGIITVDENNSKYDSRDDCNAIIEKESNKLLYGCKNTVIPSSVTSIDQYAFKGCSSLSSLYIPGSLKYIYSIDFGGCTSLTSITVGEGVKGIGSSAFNGLKNVTVTLPNSLTKIGSQAFSGSSGCTVIIGAGIQQLSDAFYNTYGMTIYIHAFERPQTSYHCFYMSNNCKSYVPYGRGEAYSNGSGLEGGSYWCSVSEMPYPALTIGSSGYATYCSNKALDFSEVEDVKAYVATDFIASSNTLILTRVDKIPAGEGIIVVGKPGTYDIPECTTDLTYNNLLNGMSYPDYVEPTDGDYTNLLFTDSNAELSFKPMEDVTPFFAGTAYLHLPSDCLPVDAQIVNLHFQETDCTDISLLDNAIYIEPVEGLVGTTIDLCVKMKNVLTPVGCSFMLTLPDGLRLQKDEDGDVVYQLGSRAKKMSLTSKDWNDGTYNFALMPSTSTATISGSDDVIVTFKLPILEDMEADEYKLKLTKCLIQSKADGTTIDYPLSDVVTTLTVEDYVIGDVNGDRKVTPSDAIMILYHYFDVEQTGFNVKAADVNGDGSVTPADAIEALYIYFNDGSQSNARQMQQTLDPQ